MDEVEAKFRGFTDASVSLERRSELTFKVAPDSGPAPFEFFSNHDAGLVAKKTSSKMQPILKDKPSIPVKEPDDHRHEETHSDTDIASEWEYESDEQDEVTEEFHPEVPDYMKRVCRAFPGTAAVFDLKNESVARNERASFEEHRACNSLFRPLRHRHTFAA